MRRPSPLARSALAVSPLLLCALGACSGSHPTSEAALAATVVAACDGTPITAELAAGLWQGAEEGPSSCASEARSCEALAACAMAEPGECTGAPRCEGDTLVRCVDGAEVREGCDGLCLDASAGATCVDREEPCEATRCLNSNVLLECVDGTHVRERGCQDRLGGAICAVQGGVAACTPTTQECADGRTECDGDDGRVCYEGVWVDFPCSEVGFLCQVPEAGTLRCIAP